MLKFAVMALAMGALAATGSACSPAAASREVDKNTYVSEKFGITATAPEGWYVMDSDVTKKLMDVGLNVSTAGADAQTKAAMDASLDRASNIFGFLKHPPGAPVEETAGIMAVAEDVSIAPGVTRGSDYFFHMRKLFERTGQDVQIADSYTTVDIGGQSFDRMDLTMTMMGHTASQRYFAARHANDIIAFIQSYSSPEDLATLDAVLKSIKLAW